LALFNSHLPRGLYESINGPWSIKSLNAKLFIEKCGQHLICKQSDKPNTIFMKVFLFLVFSDLIPATIFPFKEASILCRQTWTNPFLIELHWVFELGILYFSILKWIPIKRLPTCESGHMLNLSQTTINLVYNFFFF